MRISFSDLETLRTNPQGFSNRVRPIFRKPPYSSLLRQCALRYHRQGWTLPEGLADMEFRFQNCYKSTSRLEEMLSYLSAYIGACQSSNSSVFAVAREVTLILPDELEAFQVFGQIPRLDYTSDGYAVWLLSKEPREWGQELRLPLIQAAVASELNADLEEVQMRCYCFSEATYTPFCFTQEQVDAARAELYALLGQVQ